VLDIFVGKVYYKIMMKKRIFLIVTLVAVALIGMLSFVACNGNGEEREADEQGKNGIYLLTDNGVEAMVDFDMRMTKSMIEQAFWTYWHEVSLEDTLFVFSLTSAFDIKSFPELETVEELWTFVRDYATENFRKDYIRDISVVIDNGYFIAFDDWFFIGHDAEEIRIHEHDIKVIGEIENGLMTIDVTFFEMGVEYNVVLELKRQTGATKQGDVTKPYDVTSSNRSVAELRWRMADDMFFFKIFKYIDGQYELVSSRPNMSWIDRVVCIASLDVEIGVNRIKIQALKVEFDSNSQPILVGSEFAHYDFYISEIVVEERAAPPLFWVNGDVFNWGVFNWTTGEWSSSKPVASRSPKNPTSTYVSRMTERYYIYVRRDDSTEFKFSRSVNTNSVSIPSVNLYHGRNEIAIRQRGGWNEFYNGVLSLEIDTRKAVFDLSINRVERQLSAPENFTITNDWLSSSRVFWTSVLNAREHRVYVQRTGESDFEFFRVMEQSAWFEHGVSIGFGWYGFNLGDGLNRIKVQAVRGEDGVFAGGTLTIYHPSEFAYFDIDMTLYYVQMPTPTNLRIEGNTLQWESERAIHTDYDVWFKRAGSDEFVRYGNIWPPNGIDLNRLGLTNGENTIKISSSEGFPAPRFVNNVLTMFTRSDYAYFTLNIQSGFRQLSTPTNLRIQTESLRLDSPPHADRIRVYLQRSNESGFEFVTQTQVGNFFIFSVQLMYFDFKTGVNTIRVAATRESGAVLIDGQWLKMTQSNYVYFSLTVSESVQMRKPTITFSPNNGQVWWGWDKGDPDYTFGIYFKRAGETEFQSVGESWWRMRGIDYFRPQAGDNIIRVRTLAGRGRFANGVFTPASHSEFTYHIITLTNATRQLEPPILSWWGGTGAGQQRILDIISSQRLSSRIYVQLHEMGEFEYLGTITQDWAIFTTEEAGGENSFHLPTGQHNLKIQTIGNSEPWHIGDEFVTFLTSDFAQTTLTL